MDILGGHKMEHESKEIEEAFQLLERLRACVHDAQARDGIAPSLLEKIGRIAQESGEALEWIQGQETPPKWALDGLTEQLSRYIENYTRCPHQDMSNLSQAMFRSRMEQRRFATGIFVNDLDSYKDREAMERVLAGEFVDKKRLEKRASANAFDIAFRSLRWDMLCELPDFEMLYISNRNLDDFWDHEDDVLLPGLFSILESRAYSFSIPDDENREDSIRCLILDGQRRLASAKTIIRNAYGMRKLKSDKALPDLAAGFDVYVGKEKISGRLESADLNFELDPTYKKDGRKKVLADAGTLKDSLREAMKDVIFYSGLIKWLRPLKAEIDEETSTKMKKSVGKNDWIKTNQSEMTNRDNKNALNEAPIKEASKLEKVPAKMRRTMMRQY